MNKLKGWRTGRGWRVVGIPLLCLAATAVSAATGGPITGHNGTVTTFLFDSDDIKALDEWDGYNLAVGHPNSYYAGKTTLAVDEAGTVYTLVRGDNPDDFHDAVVGVVAGNSTTVETVYYNPYDGSGDWDMFNALALSPFSVGSGSARIDAGDVVLLSEALRDYDEETEHRGLLIQAFDPDDAAGTIRDLYYTEDFLPGSFLFLDANDKSIVLPRGDYVERIAYDANSGVWTRTTVTLDSEARSNGSIVAMDENGDLYMDYKEWSSGAQDFRIKKVDASTGELLTSTWADPTGAPKSYAHHKMGGFCFDSNGKMWLADWKKSKSPSHFIAKRKNNGKFSYKKRIAGWEDGSNHDMMTLQCGADGVLYAIMRDSGADTYAIWSID